MYHKVKKPSSASLLRFVCTGILCSSFPPSSIPKVSVTLWKNSVMGWVFFFLLPPVKSEKFECSWHRHRDVLKVVNPLSVSIHCQMTLWVRASFHNHCLLIRQHCHQPLFGKMAWMPHYQNISILRLWKRNWKNLLPEVEAWRHCSPGDRDWQHCLGWWRWNRSREGEDRRRRNLQVCSLPRRIQCRTFVEQTWVPSYLLASACLKWLAAFLQKQRTPACLMRNAHLRQVLFRLDDWDAIPDHCVKPPLLITTSYSSSLTKRIFPKFSRVSMKLWGWAQRVTLVIPFQKQKVS